MGTFLRTLLVVTGMLLLAGAPVLVVSWRVNRKSITRGFAAAAVGFGIFFAFAAVSSDRLVRECGESGSIACLDVGYQGLLFFVALVYFIASVVVAGNLHRG